MVALSAVAGVFLHTLALLLALAGAGQTRAVALGLAVVALAAALIGSSVRWPCRYNAVASRLVPSLLRLAVVVNFGGLLLVLPAVQAILKRPYWATFGVAVLAAPSLASYSRVPLMPPRLRFPWILAVAMLLGGLMIRAEPEPYIDLWYMQQRACGLVLRGENPYAALYPNIYPDGGDYGAAVVRGHSILSFCYPPLSILLALPGYCLAGDVRWSLLAATGVAATLLVAAGRRFGLPAGHWGELGAALLLLHPLTPVVVSRGWTEPFVTLGVALGGWALASGWGRVLGLSLAWVVTVKQYGPLWIASVWSTGRIGRRDALLGAAAAAAVLLPFAMADPALFWLGNVTHHLLSPARPDSLSVSAAIHSATGHQPSPAWGFAAAAAATWAVVRRRPAQPSRAALGGGAILLTFFLLNKAANINYHWLVMSFFALAVVSAIGEEGSRGAPDHEADPGG